MLDVKLSTLLAVHEEMSFTKAAAKLSLTQPAVSKHINLLESQLGCKLCRREKQKLVFTPEGEIVVKYAKRIEVMYASLCAEIREGRHAQKNIRIGTTRSTESDPFVVYAIGQYISSHSDISVTIVTNTVAKLYEMLENYELDIVIADKKPAGENFGVRLLDRDTLVCIVCKTSPIASQKSVTIDELKKERMILSHPSSNNRILFESTLESINESIDDCNVILEMDSVSAIKMLVRKGVGVSVVPKKSCRHDLNHRKYVGIPIENLSVVRELNMVFRKDFIYTDILDELCQIYSETEYN